MGGGYHGWYHENQLYDYWLTRCTTPLQRLYSGATKNDGGTGAFNTNASVIGQINDIVYLSQSYYSDAGIIPTYCEGTLLSQEARDAIIDYLPESWVIALSNIDSGIGTWNHLRAMWAYNHDDLVASGAEQS